MSNAILQGLIRNGGIDAVGSITPIDNISALRLLTTNTGPDNPNFIYINGYSTQLDGGQGFFEYIATDTTSVDNASTIIVDASGRCWYRVWDGVHFQAAWAGILVSNADNGSLMENVPRFCECWFKSGIYQFITYPSQSAFSNVLWRGVDTIWNCTGTIGSGSAFSLTDIAFNWDWTCDPTIRALSYNFGAGSAGDMTAAGVSPIEGIGIVSQLGASFGVGIAFGQAIPLPFAQVRSTTSRSVGKQYIEFYLTDFTVDFTGVGFSSTSHPITDPNLGDDAYSLKLSPNGNYYGGVASGVGVPYVANDKVALAIDYGAQLIWAKNLTTNGSWNSNGAANPATGVGGVSFSGMASVTAYFLTAGLLGFNSTATANFGASAFIGAIPVGFSAWGVATTFNPADEYGIVFSNGNLTVTNPLQGMPGGINSPVAYFIRPRNFSVGGFFCQASFNNAVNCFLTGLEGVVLKNGYIGVYYTLLNNSGENFSFTRCMFNSLATDGFQVFAGTLDVTFDNSSFDYNGRNGYASSVTCILKNCHLEGEGPGSPTAELFAIDGWTQLIVDCGTTFNGFNNGWPAASMFAIDGTSTVAQVHIHGSPFYDAANRQFINLDPADNIFGNIVCRAINGSSMWFPAISPGNLINPDWNFASGSLTFYPGSSGCAVQTGVVHSPQTHAVAMTGNASLGLSTMDVVSGEIIIMSMWDKVSAPLFSIGGNVVFSTADGITVATYNFATTTPIPRFSFTPLSPNFTTAARDWSLQYFAFRVPSGASKMTGNVTAVSIVTFDPASTGPNIALSNGNLTGTGTANAANVAKATSGSLAGLFYCSFTATTAAGGITGVGIANAFAFINSALGVDTNSLSYRPSGLVIVNSATVATIASYASGAVIDMAVDFTNAKIYFRPNGGNWNNSGAANPATNTGGISISALAAGVAYYPSIGLNATSDAITANFGATSYAHAAPSGFGNWPAATYYISELEMHR